MLVVSGPAPEGTPVPDAVRHLAGGARVAPRWRNKLGGLTFEIAAGVEQPRRFVKWAPLGSGLDLPSEVERSRWAARYAPVPLILADGRDAEGEWLVSRAIDAESAVSARWLVRPEIAVPAIGRALRRLHDALPVDDCPFDWGVSSRLARARGVGRDIPLHLDDAPDIDVLVVCHGDPCAPNTLLDEQGVGVAHVDLGALGTGDRWADIAVAAWSTEWNYGAGWDGLLLEAYGVEPDPVRSDYYRRLWDAT